MKPILKYVGGKTRLLSELKARMPPCYGMYFEPFFGGGALFFDLEPQRAVVSDINADLISVYRTVRSYVERVIARLEQHQKCHHDNANYYYEIRDWWNVRTATTPDAYIDSAAAFIYMNKTSFNGLWRVNKQGKFNTPKGDYANPNICDAVALRAASALLQNTILCAESFVEDESPRKGDFIYCDPPYDPISTTSDFTAYSKDGFTKEHQRQLAERARELQAKGVFVMLSNSDTPYVRELYDGFQIATVQRAGTVSSKGDKRGKVDEVIITSY